MEGPHSIRPAHTSNLILNSTDRALRVLTASPQTGALAPIHRFQDLVNRTPWHAVGFSGDGEYVFGGAGHKMSHNVFVWDREAGALIKVLEGPKESLMDADVSGSRGSRGSRGRRGSWTHARPPGSTRQS